VPISNTNREVGRLRLGEMVEGPDGTRRPASRSTWLITSDWVELLDALSQRYGGDVVLNTAGSAGAFSLSTTSDSLACEISPEQAWDTAWELWAGGACQRRCEGGGASCECPLDVDERLRQARLPRPRVCKPIGRLRVRLVGLPTAGLWRVETHSVGAISQLASFVTTAQELGIATIGVDLILERRRGLQPDGRPASFVVPVMRRVPGHSTALATRSTVAEVGDEARSDVDNTIHQPHRLAVLSGGPVADAGGADELSNEARPSTTAADGVGTGPVEVPSWYSGVVAAAQAVAETTGDDVDSVLAEALKSVCGKGSANIMTLPTNKVPGILRHLRAAQVAA
jgi:hypothetical protein